MKKIFLSLIVCILFNSLFGQDSKDLKDVAFKNLSYPTATKYATILFAQDVVRKDTSIKLWVGHCQLKGSGTVKWQPTLNEEGEYDLVLNYSADKDGASVIVRSDNHFISDKINKTGGVFNHYTNWLQFNCERRLLAGKLILVKGINIISLEISAPDKSFETNIYTLELIPVSKKPAIVKELAQIEKALPNMDWFSSMKFGIMLTWTSQTMPRTGPQKSYQDAVKDFDVNAFVKSVEQTGADYVIFSGNHAVPHFPGPLKNWEKLYPGMTTERDLIAEISDALKKKHIRFILYLATHVYAKYKQVDLKEFERINFELLSEIGKHYKDKIDSYWLDGWYQCNERFPEFNYEKFYRICKAGNPNRLLGLNTWLYTITTPWQDYWAAEIYDVGKPPTARICQYGPGKGLQFHALVVIEDDWVFTKQGTEKNYPNLNEDSLINYVSSCVGKGPVTLNLLIYQDGSIGEESMAVIERLKQRLKK